ncbi:hypothetical protein SUGI_1097180 [Cryptomeria japonica]|uniref:B3 domain-containing protein REM16 isoform X1 n=1 Tax=Cryptomeria japonica TaxID=3369 RepID=UPI0024147594|nr:B3 domain-containing protein REM16 isoform X1 [Cryptomeria japonica]GLJ51626.1 hypothetical protein SUGI_1097180 [Cryptomeria japonica]
MATDCNRLKTCKACKKRCFQIHSTNASNSTIWSFFKVMDDKCPPFLEIPSRHAKQIQSDECRYVIVEGPTGYLWESILCFCGTSPSFKTGWEKFVSYHSIQAGDIMVFRNMGERLFVVQIFHPSGYEKQITHKKEVSKQEGPDLCKNQDQQWPSAEHPIILDSDSENHFDQKPPLPSRSRVKHNADSKHSMIQPGRNFRYAVKHSMTQPGRNLRYAVKHPINQTSTSDATPDNPREIREFTKVMKKAAVTRSFWLTFPVKFCRRWLPQSRVEVVLLCQSKKWLVTYVGNRKELGIGSGWKEFVVDNQLKVGDTCTFALQNTEKYVFEVKILRG